MGLNLAWPVVPVVVAGVVVVLLGWWGLRGRRSRRRTGARAADDLVAAHLARLRALPRHRVLVRRRRLLGALLGVGALVALAGAAVVVGRPQVTTTEPAEERSRDLMLCLDASASMDDDNVAVVRAVRDVVDRLDGDRIGLTLWSGAAVTVFPLTDDRDYVLEQLDVAEQAFARGDEAYFAGVQLDEARASLIGDGLVSCTQRFDTPRAGPDGSDGSEERTRAVLLSSDNDPFGAGVYTLAEAAEYAAARDVLVYGVGAPDLAEADRAEARAAMAAASTTTGGVLALVGSDGATEALVSRIDALERDRVAVAPRTVRSDDPGPGVLLAATGVGLVVLAWVAGAVLALRDRVRARRSRGAA